MKKLIYLNILFALTLFSCDDQEVKSDAYGNFEAVELTVSSEMPGKIISLKVTEGQLLKYNELLGAVDTSLLVLQRKTLLASAKSIRSTHQNVKPQLKVIDEEQNYLKREIERIEKLISGNAATTKQLDDLNGKLNVLKAKRTAIISQYKDMNNNVALKVDPIKEQVEQVNTQILKSRISSPMDGQVLNVFKRTGEMTSPGLPLFKMANLNKMELKAFISGKQLAQVKLGQKVEVLIDESIDTSKKYEGKIIWISSKAEFTPKTILTKEERVNQVYAVKVAVVNDGFIKIGMPGEMNFINE